MSPLLPLLLVSSAVAGSPGAGAAVEAGGSLSANLHLGVLSCDGNPADCPWLDFRDLLVARGHLRSAPGRAVSWRLEGALRLHATGGVKEAGDAADGNRIQPFTLDLPEAWIEAREVGVPALDLRLGVQRFAWGVADGVNPVDVVNPYDLADPTRFDQRLGVPAATGRLHHRQAALEVAWIPLFRPARMPSDLDILKDADQLFDFSDIGGGDLHLGELQTRTTVPDNRLGFGSVAARASVAAPVADVALVFYRGRDSLPQVGGQALLVGFATDVDRVDVGIPVVYPKVMLAGLEVRGELPLQLAGWVEGALVAPERLTVTASRGQLDGLLGLGVIDEIPDPLPETVIQDGRPYGRWVAGLERFFGPLALNAQWVHGLPTERRAGELRDYAALAAQITASETVRVRLQGVSDGRGWLAGGAVSMLHRDAATLTVGGTLVMGPPGSALGQLQRMSNANASLEVAF